MLLALYNRLSSITIVLKHSVAVQCHKNSKGHCHFSFGLGAKGYFKHLDQRLMLLPHLKSFKLIQCLAFFISIFLSQRMKERLKKNFMSTQRISPHSPITATVTIFTARGSLQQIATNPSSTPVAHTCRANIHTLNCHA